MKSQDVVPVVISILVIVLVAIIEKQSKLAAAVTATMPLTVPLALWIVYVSAGGDRVSVEQFTRSMVIGIVPTIAFVIAVWLAARAGLKLVPILVTGYGVWGLVLALVIGVKHVVGL